MMDTDNEIDWRWLEQCWSQKHLTVSHIWWYKNLCKKHLVVAKHVWDEFSWHTSGGGDTF